MNDVDRWVQGDGPEPQEIRALLDPARAVPEMPPGCRPSSTAPSARSSSRSSAARRAPDGATWRSPSA